MYEKENLGVQLRVRFFLVGSLSITFSSTDVRVEPELGGILLFPKCKRKKMCLSWFPVFILPMLEIIMRESSAKSSKFFFRKILIRYLHIFDLKINITNSNF